MKNHHKHAGRQSGEPQSYFYHWPFFWSIGLSLQSQRKQQIFFFPFDESCQHLNVSEEKKAEFHSVKALADVNVIVADISLGSNLTKKTF